MKRTSSLKVPNLQSQHLFVPSKSKNTLNSGSAAFLKSTTSVHGAASNGGAATGFTPGYNS
jgi:hypothetical protein